MGSDTVSTVYGSIAADFEVATLGDLCVPNGGVQTGPFGSQLHSCDYVETGTPIITVEHLGENRIIHSNLPYVSNEDRIRLVKFTLQPGDIVFSRVGSVDRRALVRPEEKGWLFSGRCLRVRPDSLQIDTSYLSWFFGLPGFKDYISKIAVGATMPSLNTTILSNVPIYFPRGLSEQRAIAAVLGALDDKIELNRRMNETLEGMAHAIFKSWFVDFDPVREKMARKAAGSQRRDWPSRPGMEAQRRKQAGLPDHIVDLFPEGFEDSELGEIPSGWSVTTLADLFPANRDCVLTGPFGSNLHASDYRDDGVPLLLVKNIIDGRISEDSMPRVGWHKVPELERYRLKLGDIVFTRVGAVGRSAFIHPRYVGWMISGQTLRVRIPDRRRLHPRYISAVYQYPSFTAMVESYALGTTRPSLNTRIVENLKFLGPPPELQARYAELVEPLDTKRLANLSQIIALTALRDTLLPELISGNLRIKQATRR